MTSTGKLDPALFSDETIAEETRALNAGIVKAMQDMPDWWVIGADRVRAARRSGGGIFPAPVFSDRAKTIEIDGPTGKIALRVLAPANPRGVYLHFHGGGHVLGAADLQDRLLEIVADATGLTCISVDYRLAPENPFPAGPDDCEAAARWVVAHQGDFGGAKLATGGESAGAHLAALTMLRLRDKHGIMPYHAANLVYGVFDLSKTPSARQFGDERLVLRTLDIEKFGEAALPNTPPEACRTAALSPLYADLRGLCPALFTIGTRDALLDDSLFMHARWVAAGNAGELDVYPGACHGFTAFPYEQARAAMRAQCEFINRALA